MKRMNKKGQVGLELIGPTLMILLVIAILAIVIFIVFANLTPVVTSLDTSRTTYGIEQASGQNLTAGYTFPLCNARTDGTIDVLNVTNSSNAYQFNSANYTISGCTVTGITALAVTTVNMNATWSYSSGGTNANSIGNNISSGMVTFVTYVPTIMSILAVVIIIAAVAILIFYVKGFEGREQGM